MLSRNSGFTLLEVLITLIVLAVGMLGLASLQSTSQIVQVESYQRAQAVLLMQDMVNRIQAARADAPNYATATDEYLGYGDPDLYPEDTYDEFADCAALGTIADRDRCEWGLALRGASETEGGNKTGAMIGARGCIEQITAPNPASGVCTPGSYRVTVAWQGLSETTEPLLACAAGTYGADGYRRLVSTQFTIGIPTCL